jgi:hypothetical protein
MTPLDLRARRRALGLRVADVAYAARLRAWEVVDPSLDAALRIDAALTILEAGGCLDVARAASVPMREQNATVSRGNLQRNRVDRSRQPPWPEHTGAERLSGQCFADVELRSAAIPRSVPAGGRGAGRGRA